MRAERFGSYSISLTLDGIPNLLRLKSMIRYCCLCPPPRRRSVTWPWLLRPPDFFAGSSSDFSGVARVISSNPLTIRNRVPAVTGRNCLMLMASALEDGDHVAVLQQHDRLLPQRGGPGIAAPRHRLPAHHHRAHLGHRHPEELLERLPDERLGRLRVHLEGVFLPRLECRRALLGQHRTHDDLAQRDHLLAPLL